jgi:hypothetical protein
MLGHQQNDERAATCGCAGGLPIVNFLLFSVCFEVANRMRCSLRLRKEINDDSIGRTKDDRFEHRES